MAQEFGAGFFKDNIWHCSIRASLATIPVLRLEALFMNEEKSRCPNLFALKRPPGHTERLSEEQDYYVNVDLITFVSQNTQNPDQSSLRFVGSDRVLYITESAENFLSRAGRA